jgi:hypothetical protein
LTKNFTISSSLDVRVNLKFIGDGIFDRLNNREVIDCAWNAI